LTRRRPLPVVAPAFPERAAASAPRRRGGSTLVPGIVLAALLLGFSSARAQVTSPPAEAALPSNYSIREWTPKNGMPTGTVRGLVETDEGYLWLATSYGLVRFDGTRFTSFDATRLPPLVTNQVYAIDKASQGGLWLATTGMVVFRTDGERVLERLSDRSSAGEGGGRIAVAADGTVWATTPRSVRRFLSGAWTTFGETEGLRGEPLNVIVDRAGRAWARNYETLFRQDGEGFVRASDDPDLAIRKPLAGPALLFADSDGCVWAARNDGLSVVRASGEYYRVDTRPALGGPVIAMAEARSGDLWLGTARGVYSMPLPRPHQFDTRPRTVVAMPGLNLQGSAVNALLVTSSGTVVVATDGAGLRLAVPRMFRLIGADDGLPDVRIHHVATDGHSGAWMGTACTLAHVDDALRVSVADADALGLSGCVRSLLRDRGGALWVGQSGGGLTRIAASGRLRSWGRADGLPPADIGPLFEDREGRIWVGASRGPLCRIDGDLQLRCPALPATLPPGKVWSLAETPDGALWIGQAGTLTQMRGRDVRTLTRDDGIPAAPLRFLRADGDGTLWIGSFGGGLARLRHGRLAGIAAAQGLFDNALSALVVDGRRRAWLMGNQGVFVVPYEALDPVAEGLRSTIEGVLIGPTDDMPEGNGGHPSALASPSGRLFFATVRGLAVFDDAPAPGPRPQRVVLEAVRDRGHALDLAQEVVVGPGGGPVEFQFAAPNLSHPERTAVKFQLVGRDPGWVQARSAFAGYSDLAPGLYEFRLMVRDEAGTWAPPFTALRVRMLPHWWQTLWVRLLGALLATAAIAALVQARLSRMRRANLALAYEVAERKRAQEQAHRHLLELAHVSRLATAGELTATLTHELGQPLTAIGAGAEAARLMVETGADTSEISTTLADVAQQSARAAQVVRGMRLFLRRGVSQAMQLDMNDEIREVVHLLKSTLDTSLVTLSLDLTEGAAPAWGERVPIQQVLLNLILNAADAMRTSGSPRRLLLVRSSCLPGATRVSVVDSGPGIDAARRTKIFDAFHTTKAEGMGIGLSICRSIVEAHGGRITTRNLPGCGAVFSFTLPPVPPGLRSYNRAP